MIVALIDFSLDIYPLQIIFFKQKYYTCIREHGLHVVNTHMGRTEGANPLEDEKFQELAHSSLSIERFEYKRE